MTKIGYNLDIHRYYVFLSDFVIMGTSALSVVIFFPPFHTCIQIRKSRCPLTDQLSSLLHIGVKELLDGFMRVDFFVNLRIKMLSNYNCLWTGFILLLIAIRLFDFFCTFLGHYMKWADINCIFP